MPHLRSRDRAGKLLRNRAAHAGDWLLAMRLLDCEALRLFPTCLLHYVEEHSSFFRKVGGNLVTIGVANLFPVVTHVF